MNLIDPVVQEITCALRSYESTVESLKLKPIIMGLVLSPMFYLLFFFMVRLQSIAEGEIASYLLQTLLILPIGLCVFYVGTSFSKMKQWGVMKPLLLVEYSLFRLAVQMAMVAVLLSFTVSLFWFVLLDMVVIDFELDQIQTLLFLLIMLSSIFCAAAFGIMAAVLILPMKERHLVTNALFFFLIIFSGLMFQTGSGWVFWPSHLLPLTPFVSALKSLLNGHFQVSYLLFGYVNALCYLAVAKLLIDRMQVKMQEGNTEF